MSDDPLKQDASAQGSGNTVVQIVGDGNCVVTGHPHLVLTRYLARWQIRHDLDRLSPYTRSTTLVGRDSEMASLQAFLASTSPISARVLTGGGGSGKTRLALELCDTVSAQGWAAGFVGRTELKRFFAQQNLSTWGWSRPTLIVVDYAAEHAQLLGQWFDELADRTAPAEHPLRVLLLERSASTESGWWTVVFASGGWGAMNKRALLDPAEPVPVEPLADTSSRLAVLRAMLAQSDRATALPMDEADLGRQLGQSSWGGDPLFLMMAALAMTELGQAKALTLGRLDLADALAAREADRLRQLAAARALSPELVQHLAALVTLAQGLRREDFETFAEEEKQAIRRQTGGDTAALADLLQQALPRPNAIAPVLPDLIGEAFITRTLKAAAGQAAVLRCYKTFGQPVAETVSRTAQDFSLRTSAPVAWLSAIALAVADDDQALTSLMVSLPMDSVALRDVSLEVSRRLVDLRRARPDCAPESTATALYGLAVALAKTGQFEHALRAAQEAVDLYRRLATQHPDVFRHDLSASLNTIANILGDLGRRQPALLAAQECVDLRRELAALRPDVFQPNLAMALNTLAIGLKELDQREPALRAAQEAVNLYRPLATRHPDVFQHDLAMALNTLAAMLCELGLHQPALCAAQEAVELYRELDARRPDIFRPNMAASINNLSAMLSDLGQHEPALLAAQQAVDLYRDLAALRPDVFRPNLARSLNNLANRLHDLKQHESALSATEETVDLFREFASLRPDVFRSDLAMSLRNLSIRLDALEMREPALLAAQESTDLYRELVALRPDVFLPNLARSLIVLALRTHTSGRYQDAINKAQEAIELLSPSLLRYPKAHQSLMRWMLEKYRHLCQRVGAEPNTSLLDPLQSFLGSEEISHDTSSVLFGR